MLRISSVWRIREIDFHVKVFIHAGIIFLHENLLDPESLQITKAVKED